MFYSSQAVLVIFYLYCLPVPNDNPLIFAHKDYAFGPTADF
jgi:hypothetical protein